MGWRRVCLVTGLAAVALGAALLALVRLGLPGLDGDGAAASGDFDVTGALSGEAAAEGFARVTGPQPLVFPDDHGAHPDYRHEWWYVTGNVTTRDGRPFAFQVTLFRFALAPEPPERDSPLASRQLWMGHLAITDPESGAFHHRERFARGAPGLAGASSDPPVVHVEDWFMRGSGPDLMPLTLDFPADGMGLEITLTPRKPKVLQGESGYSRKGDAPGNASRYYSWTRLGAEGELQIGDTRHAVRGSAWMDREWGSSTLTEDQVGWDWFALQLDDGRDLMVYHLRREDGSVEPRSKGILVAPDGRSRVLSLEDFSLEARRHWTRPGGGDYPVAWRLRVPSAGLDLDVEAVLDDQELRGAFRYWEGAVRVRGAEGERGHGHAELTGY